MLAKLITLIFPRLPHLICLYKEVRESYIDYLAYGHKYLKDRYNENVQLYNKDKYWWMDKYQ